ncbi:hypothetical protein GJAV_G00006250 [Gymnothorax javanicus]|nr:hypothetical protein GJAV_G00006250 [Gymnothorax javanicus]
MGEVRKLHKKLRQIESLEIKAFLTPEESVKISKKEELRARLAELLLQHSTPQQPQGIVGDDKEDMKRKVLSGSTGSLVPQTPSPKVQRVAPQEASRQEPAETPENEAHGVSVNTESTVDSQDDTRFTAHKAAWEKAGFRLRPLEGHSDIVTCVLAVDNLVVSGSRDTTIKYCRRLARLLSLGDSERFILSGSDDCCIKVWVLSTGCCVKSIYTFNPVSALTFIPEGDGHIVTGSDGGKVEVWSWDSMDCCQSVKKHEDSVTSLQCQGPLLFSGSADGAVSVWEFLWSAPAPMKHLHHWSSSVTGCDSRNSSSFSRLALSPRGDKVFLANGRASLKILNWRTGSVSRLTNHSSVAGVTDCVTQTPGILIASCFDLATGESSLNLFSLPQCKYLVSLACPESPRILCFTTWQTASGDHRWVTGGRVLMVWEQLASKSKERGDVTVRRDSRLDIPPVESDRDTDEDSDEYSEEDCMSQDTSETEEELSSSWLRCSLHSISPVTRWATLCCLLAAVTTRPVSCDGGDGKGDGGESERGRAGEPQTDVLSPQLSVTTQATPTPLWAVVWGPTHPLEDETPHFLPGQETDLLNPTTESWQLFQNPPTTKSQQLLLGERNKEGDKNEEGETKSETEEVDPQFYVTVTISSLLILTAVIITAKLCYDRSCSQHPPPLSRGAAPPLSLSLPRSLASEDSRQVLHSTPSFTDRER